MIRLRLNPPLDDALTSALVDVWVATTNAGGAVGFVAPTSASAVRPLADRELGAVASGDADLAVAVDGEAVVGFGLLAPNLDEVQSHWGTIRRLQRHPRRRGAGIGALLLAELEARALHRGLEFLTLSVREGTGREAFYVAHGYRVVASLPGFLRVGAARLDSVVLVKALPPPDEAAGEASDRATQDRPRPAIASDRATEDRPRPAIASDRAAEDSPRSAAASDRAAEDRPRPAAVVAADAAAQEPVVLPVRRLDAGLAPPAYAHSADAGLDLRARTAVRLAPGERAVVPTGVAVAIPPGHVGLVHPRSGLAARQGLGLVNAPGTIDSGYRGEVKVIAVNHDPRTAIDIARGDRIAQLVVQPVTRVRVTEVDRLDDGDRGTGGFGSTGR